MIDQVRDVEVGLVAGGDQLREADAAADRPREQGAQDAAALGDQRDVALRELLQLQGTAGREHDPVGDVDEADRVGPQEAHRACRLLQRLLPLLALGTRLTEAGRQDDRRTSASLRQLLHGLQNMVTAEEDKTHVRHGRKEPMSG